MFTKRSLEDRATVSVSVLEDEGLSEAPVVTKFRFSCDSVSEDPAVRCCDIRRAEPNLRFAGAVLMPDITFVDNAEFLTAW